LSGIGADFWSAISATRVEQYLKTEREKVDGISTRTSNFHLQAARQFSKWAVRTGFASEDPLRVLRPLDVQATQKRRALSADELARLLVTTADGPPRDGSTGAERPGGIPGPERALLYRMAAETGLRRNELKTLHVADLDLADVERACANVRATNTKNRREAHLPLRPDLASALRSHIRERLPSARVFTLPKDFRAAAMLRADLAAADIPYEDDAGRVVDFHSLRVTFATNLARGGVALQLAQRLLRHSTPVLTANVYTVLGRDDDRKAIEKLPEVGVGRGGETARATGTDAAAAASPPTRTSPAPRSRTKAVEEPPPSPSPTDPRLAALISAWNHLDEQARTVLVRTAEVMARG
jgi:integrase